MTGETPSHSWLPVDLRAVDAEPSTPELSGLVYPGLRHVFSGPPESAKSWLAGVLSVEQLRVGRDVIWVDFEMGRKPIKERLEVLGITERSEEFGGFILLTPSEPLLPGSAAEDDVRRLVEKRQPSLVVFDAMTGALDVHGLDSNSDVHVDRLYRQVFDVFRANDAAVVIIDHVAKNPESRNGYPVGSQRKSGAADVHLGLTAVRQITRGGRGLVRIDVHKDRPGALARPSLGELELRSDRSTGRIQWSFNLRGGIEDGSERFRPTVLMERVSRFLEDRGTPATMSEIERGVPGKAHGKRTAVDVLIDEGYAAERSGEKGARLIESMKPYRDDEDVDDGSVGPDADLDELFGPVKEGV